MKRSLLLIAMALIAIFPRESAAQMTESDCFSVLPPFQNTELGFCGVQFWMPDTQECYSTLVPSGTVCTPAASPCEKPSVCQFHGSFQDVKMSCTPLGTPKSKTLVCRPSTAVCDQDDYCDGTSLQCPEDEPAPVTKLCRPAAGACDVSDFCDGESKSCPDELVPEGEVCRDMENQCDANETCDGVSAFCPEDELGGGMECDDGDECTDGDTCTQGQCIGDGIDSCGSVDPDPGSGDESPDAGTGPGAPDAGVSDESDAGDDVDEDSVGGCSVATQGSHAGWLLVFMAALFWTRRRSAVTARDA